MATLPFTAVLKATLESTIEVVLICGGGYLLALRGILDKPSQRSLSRANLYLFTPCLIFAKLGGQLRWTVVKNLWAIPVLVAILIGVGYVVARIGSRIFRLDRQWEKFVVACTIFQNTNAPPIAIIMSLSSTLSNALYCRLIPNDSADRVMARGILYLLLISQLTLVIRWSYGYRYLLAPDPSMDAPKISTTATETTPLSTSKADTRENFRHFNVNSDYNSTEHSTGSTSTMEPAFDRIDRRSLRSLSRESLTSFPALSIRSGDVPSHRLTYSVSTVVWKIAGAMNPPLWAVIASVTIALVSPLQQEIFFDTSSFLHNSVFIAIDTTGAVAIPLILVSLGAALVKASDMIDSPTFPTDIKMERRGIFLALFARLALVPILVTPLLITAMYLGFQHDVGVLSDPIFWVVVFLIVGTPASLQLTQITQIHGIWERELAKVLWWGYAVFCVPSTMIGVIVSLELLKWCRT